ncbi:MAG: hypothetical protein KDC66_13750 [Phaeodactylibacter sp.]|nr:hypothetical protein [Phaeodactylibacter sp.]MCB9273958.1 hypothetical protein [Lewinellaceae bacterium]
MKKTFILLLFLPLWAGLLNGQTKADLADCIKIALASPEMEAAFTQEWGEKRPLYLQKPERRDIAPQPIDELMGQLEAEDFSGFQWEVMPATPEAIRQLPVDELSFGVLNLGATYRESWNAMSLNLFVALPQYPRRWLAGSFVLAKEDERWQIVQKSVDIRP